MCVESDIFSEDLPGHNCLPRSLDEKQLTPGVAVASPMVRG